MANPTAATGSDIVMDFEGPIKVTQVIDANGNVVAAGAARASTIADPAAMAAITSATLTDNSGGSETPDGTISEIADIALSTTDTYTDAAVNAAVNAVVDDCANAIEECADQINKLVADITAAKTAIDANNAAIDAILVVLEDHGLVADA